MTHIRRPAWARTLILTALTLFLSGGLESADIETILREIIPIPSTTGYERPLSEKIRTLLPAGLAIEEDGLGGFAVRYGRGAPRILLLASLDDFGFIASGITPDGYLTLDRPLPAPHPYYDGFLLGNPVVVSTRKGLVDGVVAQPSLHMLSPERRKSLVDQFGLENALVDIGARSESEVREKGIELLDAVTFRPSLADLAGGRLTGPSLGVKGLCAVLAEVAIELAPSRPEGEVILAFAAQTKFAVRGRGPRVSLGALRARNRWEPEKVVILAPAAQFSGKESQDVGGGPVFAPRHALDAFAPGGTDRVNSIESAADFPLSRAFEAPGRETLSAGVPILYRDTPGETIDLSDLRKLAAFLEEWLKKGDSR